jgi:hypothetical protein
MNQTVALLPSRRKGWGLAVVSILVAWVGVATASAATLHVCRHGCAYGQVADAVAAANNNDSVVVADGIYRGGFTIDKNLTVAGAGALRTTIRGGGPVITVGRDGAQTEPAATIRGVTITGGRTTSAFGTMFEALGGGVWIPPSTGYGPGASVKIIDSAITGNTAAPATSVDSGLPCGPSGDCPFAHAGGGGIDSWGELQVKNTIVSGNQASGAVTSDATGAGIYSQQGTLVIDHSVISGNRTVATVPAGRFAEGAGIMFDTFFSLPGTCAPPQPTCRLVIRESQVTGNASTLTSTLPSFAGGALLNMNANAGGIHVGDGIATSVENTTIDGNTASATDQRGEPGAIDAAMIVGDSPVVIDRAEISDNRTIAITATTADVGALGTAIELDGAGTISHTNILGNVAISITQSGAAAATGGLAVFNFSAHAPRPVSVRDTVIASNFTAAMSGTGSASVIGGAVFNNSLLQMSDVRIRDNFVGATGSGGSAQGGGIWNGVDLSGPPVELTLRNSSVTRNVLTASEGIARQGGGLFTTSPVTLDNTRIAQNRPDQCFGCSSPARPPGSAAAPERGRTRAAPGTPHGARAARRSTS